MASSSSSTSSLMQGLDSKSRALISKIVAHLKSQGNFDELRRDCLEELDKMESFRQLNQRVESYVATFLSKQEWSDTLSKNQMRDSLRKHVCASETLNSGSQRLVTQVIEKRSRAFQTRLEGIVQNFIYQDKERERQERQARYQGKYYQQSSKFEQEKAASLDKTSGISDVNDIISQIKHSEVESTTKTDTSSSVKSETVTSQQQYKGETGVLSKPEQTKHEKKTDVSSPSESSKGTPPSKSNLTKRLNPSKRFQIPKVGASPNPSSPSEKLSESPSGSKHPKQGNLSYIETQQKSVHEGINVEALKKIDTSSQKPDVGKVTTVSIDSGKNLQETKVKIDDENIKLKVEDVHLLKSDTVKDDTKTEASVVEKELKQELISTTEYLGKQSTEFSSIGLDQKDVNKAQYSKVKVSYDDDLGDKNNVGSFSHESDIDDSVSDVSSVHTSDLSSFDGEVSVSESSDDDNPQNEERQNLQNIKKRKTKQGSENQVEKIHGQNPGRVRSKDQTKRNDSEPSRRGRPRKDQAKARAKKEGKSTARHSRSRHRDDQGSSEGIQARDSSKRQIKKKRCYSPSSEGTREVCLPSKRSRVNSRD